MYTSATVITPRMPEVNRSSPVYQKLWSSITKTAPKAYALIKLSPLNARNHSGVEFAVPLVMVRVYLCLFL